MNYMTITYDIVAADDNKRDDVSKYLKQRVNWIHVENSVWVVKTPKSIDVIMTKLKGKIPNSSITITQFDNNKPQFKKLSESKFEIETKDENSKQLVDII